MSEEEGVEAVLVIRALGHCSLTLCVCNPLSTGSSSRKSLAKSLILTKQFGSWLLPSSELLNKAAVVCQNISFESNLG